MYSLNKKWLNQGAPLSIYWQLEMVSMGAI